MRLLDTATVEVIGDEYSSPILDHQKYAILSHTWANLEISLQDLSNPDTHWKPGYKKIADFCKRAFEDGYSYAWADTCCIDKQSSAELSEAINSMFNWYEMAERCYVYLEDVHIDEGLPVDQLRQSRWFTRGWTLQELLAPRDIVFYDSLWRVIGTKWQLKKVLQEITGISDLDLWEKACIAQKFSWAANRQTRRYEDAAYSLLGIFGVNMPLIYGEGHRAFTRLQREIAQHTDDESIFAWGPLPNQSDEGTLTGPFAMSPANFIDCANISTWFWDRERPPWSTHNQGFEIKAFVSHVIDFRSASDSRPTYILPLNCHQGRQKAPLGIVLKQISSGKVNSPGSDRYQRLTLKPRAWLTSEAPAHERSTLVIPQSLRTYTNLLYRDVRPVRLENTVRACLVVKIDTRSFEENGIDISAYPTRYVPGFSGVNAIHRRFSGAPAGFTQMDPGARLFGTALSDDSVEAGHVGGLFDSTGSKAYSCILFRNISHVLFEWRHESAAIGIGIIYKRNGDCEFYRHDIHQRQILSPSSYQMSPAFFEFGGAVVSASANKRFSQVLGAFFEIIITADKHYSYKRSSII